MRRADLAAIKRSVVADADVAISQNRIAKILGREPTKMTIRLSDAFGDFEQITCEACGGSGRLGQRKCPVCDDCDLAIEMRRTRETVRESIEIIRATQDSTDVEAEWKCETARNVLANALADLRAMKRAWKQGAR